MSCALVPFWPGATSCHAAVVDVIVIDSAAGAARNDPATTAGVAFVVRANLARRACSSPLSASEPITTSASLPLLRPPHPRRPLSHASSRPPWPLEHRDSERVDPVTTTHTHPRAACTPLPTGRSCGLRSSRCGSKGLLVSIRWSRHSPRNTGRRNDARPTRPSWSQSSVTPRSGCRTSVSRRPSPIACPSMWPPPAETRNRLVAPCRRMAAAAAGRPAGLRCRRLGRAGSRRPGSPQVGGRCGSRPDNEGHRSWGSARHRWCCSSCRAHTGVL